MKRLVMTLALGVTFIAHASSRQFTDSLSEFPSSLNKQKLALIVGAETAFYLGGMSYLHFIWYKDKERVPFHFYDDSKGYLQIDKMGHAFGSYLESYYGYRWLRSAGVKKKGALLFGATLGIVLQTPIEVFDGMYEGWGFSWPDMAANALGSGIVAGQELLWNEQLIKFKFSFWRSDLAEMAHGKLGDSFGESLLLDYNGHTYWFSLPVNRLLPFVKTPDWLCLSAGYSANGMLGEFENARTYKGKSLPEASRYRQYLLSLDVDLTRIRTRSRFLKGLFQTLFWIKVPFPALEVNSRGQLKAHWMYF